MNYILYSVAMVFVGRWISQIPIAIIRGYSLDDFSNQYTEHPSFAVLDLILLVGFIMFCISEMSA
jgi:hypothetical protein